MSCSCHTKNKSSVEKTLPTDQCLFCAQKHYATALAAYREYTYESANRNWIIGQLQAVIGHTYREYKDIADMARSVSLSIQNANDNDSDFDKLGNLITNRIYDVDVGIKKRLKELENKRSISNEQKTT